jgi:hypothetical protein
MSDGTTNTELGSAKANGRKPKSYLGQVFNFKLGPLFHSSTSA